MNKQITPLDSARKTEFDELFIKSRFCYGKNPRYIELDW